MTQAQVDLQNQLEQATADLTTRPLLNGSPVLYIDTSELIPTTSLEQMEQEKIEHDTSKVSTSLNDIDHTHATPPPPKKRYEIMKDPVLLSSPIYPPFISTKASLSTNRDDHLIPLLSHDDLIFKAQLTFSTCILQTIHSAYMTKIKTFSYLSLQKLCTLPILA